MNKYGVGLGLTLSKNMAKALGGDIIVESVVGEGSTFTLLIKEMQKRPSEISSLRSKVIQKEKESDERNVSKSLISEFRKDNEYYASSYLKASQISVYL